MCKHYALLGTLAEVSPIHWMYGGIARLEKGEKIDKLLKGGNSTISLGYMGMEDAIKQIKLSEEDKKAFETKIIKKLKSTVDKWKEETGLGFNLCDNKDNVCINCKKMVKIYTYGGRESEVTEKL